MSGANKWGGRLVSLAVFAALAALWQVLSIIYTAEAQPGEPMVAGWQVLFTRTFLSLADYWGGGFGVPTVADGAERSYLAAALSVVSHLIYTLARLAVGLALGGSVGFALGLAVSWSRFSRGLVEWPVQFLRALPLLAMVPLFQLWFGATFLGQSVVRRLRSWRHRVCGNGQRGAQRSADLHRQRPPVRRLARRPSIGQ